MPWNPVKWRISSHSAGGDCVEVAWRQSCAGSGSCVQAAKHEGKVLIRDSKNPDGGYLELSGEEWRGLLKLWKATA